MKFMSNYHFGNLPQFRSLNPQKIPFLLSTFFFILFLNPFAGQASDTWKQFRGANRSGVTSNTPIKVSFQEGEPELLWSKQVGNGFSEVLVNDQAAFIFSGDTLESGYEYVAAYDKNNGSELWKTVVDTLWIEKDGWGHGPRSTPAMDNERLYCLSGCGKFSALNLTTGEIVWSLSLPVNFGTVTPRWGFSTSPVIVGDMVILETGGSENRAITAFNKISGEVIWSNATGIAAYCSPLVTQINEQTHIIIALDTMLLSFNEDGEEHWSFRMPLRGPMAMPVFLPPNKIFVSSESNTGSFVVAINDNIPVEIFKSAQMQNNWSSSCYHNGYLYGFSKARLQCVSAETGKMVWGKRGYGKGSLIIVGDVVVALSDQGKIVMAEANHEEFREMGSFQALHGKSWTAPTFADGKLFVRNLSTLNCYDLSK
jgi:outer membrane protein assembly factor BamB